MAVEASTHDLCAQAQLLAAHLFDRNITARMRAGILDLSTTSKGKRCLLSLTPLMKEVAAGFW